MDLLKLLPDHPKMSDKQLDRWLTERGALGREVLAYCTVRLKNPLTEEKEPFAACTCTACWAQWYAPIVGNVGSYPRFVHGHTDCGNGQTTLCPECGAEVDVAHAKRLRRWPKVSKTYPWEIVKRRGCILFICWTVFREIDMVAGDPKPRRIVYAEKRNAYMLDPAGKWHRFTAMERAGWSACSPMVCTGEWYEMKRFSLADGGHRLTLPHPADVYSGTALENAKMDRLEAVAPASDPIFYAKMYQRHPQAENLAMQCPGLLAHAMSEAGGKITQMDWIDWKKAKPHEMLRMEKPDFRAVSALTDVQKIGQEVERIRAEAACARWGIPKTYGRRLGAAGVEFVEQNGQAEPLVSFGIVTTWNYILRQQGDEESVKDAARLCKDYWRDLSANGMNDGTRATLFPRDLRTAHTRVVAAIRYKTDQKLKKKFDAMTRQIEPLAWQYNGLCIRPARGEEDLILEGKALGHCVGGYGRTHCAGNCIFFVRRQDTPNTPYYTLQLDTKTGRVLQNRGKGNCNRTEEVAAFEKAWLEEVVDPWIKKRAEKNARNTPAETKTNAA